MFLSVVGQERRRLRAAGLFRRACVEMLEEEDCVRHNKERMTRLGSLANTSPNSSCSTWLPSSWRWVREGRRGGKAAARSFTSWFLSRPRELRCGAAQKAQGSMFKSWLSPRLSRFNLRRFRRVGREVSSLPWKMILQIAS